MSNEVNKYNEYHKQFKYVLLRDERLKVGEYCAIRIPGYEFIPHVIIDVDMDYETVKVKCLSSREEDSKWYDSTWVNFRQLEEVSQCGYGVVRKLYMRLVK